MLLYNVKCFDLIFLWFQSTFGLWKTQCVDNRCVAEGEVGVGMEGAGVLALALLFPSMTQAATILQQAMNHNFTSPALWSDREL